MAVCFFVLNSGFVTHWTSASNIDAPGPLLGFYLRRLGRVLLTFWLAMLWAVYLLKREGKELPVDYVVTGYKSGMNKCQLEYDPLIDNLPVKRCVYPCQDIGSWS